MGTITLLSLYHKAQRMTSARFSKRMRILLQGSRSPFHDYSFSIVNQVDGNRANQTEMYLLPGQTTVVASHPPRCAAVQARWSIAEFAIGPEGHAILSLDGFDCYPQVYETTSSSI